MSYSSPTGRCYTAVIMYRKVDQPMSLRSTSCAICAFSAQPGVSSHIFGSVPSCAFSPFPGVRRARSHLSQGSVVRVLTFPRGPSCAFSPFPGVRRARSHLSQGSIVRVLTFPRCPSCAFSPFPGVRRARSHLSHLSL